MVTWFYFIVFILSLIMTGSFLFRNKKADTVFLLFSIMVTINCMGRYTLAAAETLEMALWANKFLYVGGCYAPLLTVLILTKLCDSKMPRILLVLLTSYSTLVLALVMTIGKSEIYYKHVELVHGDGYNYLEKTYGPLHSLYPVMMALYAVIMVAYLIYAVKKRNKISFRTVTTISLLCFSICFLYIMERLLHSDISFLSVGYLIGIGFLITYCERINKYDISSNIFNSIERMREYGYISFNEKFQYINANSLMKQLFPEIEEWTVDREVPVSDSYIYREIVQYLMAWNGEESNGKYITVADKYYQMNIRQLSRGEKRNEGYLLEFIDRTLEKKYYNTIEKYNVTMEEEVAEKTKELQNQQKKTKELFVQTVTALSEAVDAKDRYTSGHSKRVAEYSRRIAERLGKSREEQEEIYRAGLLHDVGKIRIPEEIINKAGRLTEEEYNVIKIHPVTGYHILRGVSEDSIIAIASKYHHERYDGKGYPNGLIGERIPEVARILGVADSYDAMASNRSYRNALPQEVVRGEIEKGRGTQFDPHIADIMLQMIDEDTEYQMKEAESMCRRVLTVDDEARNNKTILDIMKDEPKYEVVSAESGIEALSILTEQKIDLILLDANMPEMDGLETLRRIREHHRMPVVLMTEDKMLEATEELAELGYDDYITKPVLPLLIKEMIHNLTERTSL